MGIIKGHDYTDIYCVSDNPWADVYRIKNEKLFLKKYQGDNSRKVIEGNVYVEQFLRGSIAQIESVDFDEKVIVFKKVDGIIIGEFSSSYQLKKLLTHYAKIQCKASIDEEIKVNIIKVEKTTVLSRFLNFVNPEKNVNPHIVANYFIDDAEVLKCYHSVLSHYESLLESVLTHADQLPDTLNHGDLHTGNVVEQTDGNIVLLDWDDAIIGPAGYSLHKLMGGCTNVSRYLDDMANLQSHEQTQRALLFVYINELVKGEYANKSVLVEALPASVLLGLMESVLFYKDYPSDDKAYLETVSKIIATGVEDILDLCDYLVLQNRDSLIAAVDQYMALNMPVRAIDLLVAHRNRCPNDVKLTIHLAGLYAHTGQWSEAIPLLMAVRNNGYEEESLLVQLGIAQLRQGDFHGSLKTWDDVLAINPVSSIARDHIHNISQLLLWQQKAAIPHLAPTIVLSQEENLSNSIKLEKLEMAVQLFRQYGMVVIENAFPRNLIENIADQFFTRYQQYFNAEEYDDCLVLGDKRNMVTLDIEGALNSPALLGNQLLTGLLKNVLGQDYVLGALNVALSYAGAGDQGLHKDYKPLFVGEGQDNSITPSFAASMLTPLIDMTPDHGVTCFRKGSQLRPEQKPYDMPTQAPLLKMGDCVLFDYRVAHEGLANQSTEVRPLLCSTFHRVWFRDALNYKHQAPYRISDTELEKVSEELRHLYKWRTTT